MEFDPPIPSRSTDELIEIANYPENWNSIAVEQATKELTNRGVTIEQQKEVVEKWNAQAEKEHKREMELRAKVSYGILDLIWMTLRWPYTLFFDWSLKKEGFHRMHKERHYSILAGILLWGSMLIWVNYNYERSQQAWQNEVNNEDIYEWERNYYSDEELTSMRRESIEKVIQKVTENKSKKIPTYVIVDFDTILNDKVTDLRNIPPLTIRDVVFQASYEPDFHEWINIVLLKEVDNTGS